MVTKTWYKDINIILNALKELGFTIVTNGKNYIATKPGFLSQIIINIRNLGTLYCIDGDQKPLDKLFKKIDEMNKEENSLAKD